MSDAGDLDARILAGHVADDVAGLSDLYSQAASIAEADGEIDRACFFYTQAYVFALDAGNSVAAEELKSKLVGFGREM